MSLAHRFRVHGRVQGVGFRYYVLQRARELGIDGWVRNRSDGTVEGLAWAEEESLDVFFDQVRRGPRWGKVDRIDITVEATGGDSPGGFQIRSDR